MHRQGVPIACPGAQTSDLPVNCRRSPATGGRLIMKLLIFLEFDWILQAQRSGEESEYFTETEIPVYIVSVLR